MQRTFVSSEREQYGECADGSEAPRSRTRTRTTPFGSDTREYLGGKVRRRFGRHPASRGCVDPCEKRLPPGELAAACIARGEVTRKFESRSAPGGDVVEL
jgi:hypothetical protein